MSPLTGERLTVTAAPAASSIERTAAETASALSAAGVTGSAPKTGAARLKDNAERTAKRPDAINRPPESRRSSRRGYRRTRCIIGHRGTPQ